MRQIKGNSRASGGTPRAPAEKFQGKIKEKLRKIAKKMRKFEEK
jgi:hypothetical protein